MGACVSKKTTQLDTISARGPVRLEELRQYFEASQSEISPKLLPYFQKALGKGCKGEADISIKFVSLKREQGEHFAHVLPFYTNLKSLRLWKTQLGVEGARALAPALVGLKQLETLSLEDNGLQTEGLLALSASLKLLTKLQNLVLHVNQISPEGGKTLAILCQSHSKLQELLLSENQLSAVGMGDLVEGLLACAGSFRVLEVAHNSLQRQGAEHLLHALPRLPVLEKVVLSGNQLSEDTERELFLKAPTVHFYF